MKQTIIYVIIATALLFNQLLGQPISVNRQYQVNSGNPVFSPLLSTYGFPYSKSIKASNGDLVNVGHSFVGSSEDVQVARFDADGNVIFDLTFDILSAGKNDYAIDIFEAPNGDFLICGGTETGGATGYDSFVLRISSSGTFINEDVRDGGSGQNDFAVGIKQVGAGNVLVAANAQLTNGMFDCWLIQYDASLNYQNESFYDFAGLSDVAIGLQVDVLTSEVQIIAASASGVNSCDYAVARFDFSTLTYLGDSRTSLSGSVLDKPLAFCRDASNNTYITGMAWSGTNFQIKTVKVNANNTIGWTKICDPYGLENVGSTIQVDASGNVVVGGYITASNNTKKMVCIKYNSTTGNEVWAAPHIQAAENPSGDAFIKKIALNPAGDIYFVGSEHSSLGNERVLVGKIKSSGIPSWQRNIGNDATINYLPSDIMWEGGAVYVISVQDSINDEYITTAYTEFEPNTNVSSYGSAKYVKNQLIVRFLPSALDTPIIDNAVGTSIREFGDLKDFMKPTAYATVTTALRDVCQEEIKAIKIFPAHTTGFTSTINRLNEPVAVPDFWTALVLEFPCDNKVLEANTVFNNLTSIAAYAHPNFLAELYSAPNDSLYPQQLSLHNNTVHPGCDVNVEEAWDVFPKAGGSHVRGGVFDIGIDWEHKDFNYDGTNPATSKIVDGWSFSPSAKLKTLNHGNAVDNLHATAVAGIIGAQGNNGMGVSGIAGGNAALNSSGVNLYGLTIFDPNGTSWLGNLAPMSYISWAMYYSTLSATQPTALAVDPYVNNYCFELHFQNHSWGLLAPPSDTGYFAFHLQSISLFQEVSHKVNRMNVTSIAARGNDTGPTLSYPANFDDDWVICVTGTGVNGQFAQDSSLFSSPVNAEFTSAWGGDVDIAAPCSGSIVTTLSTPGATVNGWGSMYNSFGRTSAAAPHVSGAVALMMSYLNDTLPTSPNDKRNMAPEDCEAILQMSAKDTDSTGYDQLTGHGRLNIGKAMRLIEKPYHRLLHFDTDLNNSYSFTKQINASPQWDTIKLIDRFEKAPGIWYQVGKYIVKAYEVNTTVNHNIFSQDTIIASWSRHSSSVTFPPIVNGKLLPIEKTQIISINNSSADLRGYVYQVKDSIGNPLGWWPVDTSFISALNPMGKWSAYSVLTKNYGNPVGIDKKKNAEQRISVYPNPTNGIQTLLIETDKVSELNIDLYDIMGRRVKTVYNGKTHPKQTLIEHDVTNLPNSVYIYNIRIDGKTNTRKFIKQ